MKHLILILFCCVCIAPLAAQDSPKQAPPPSRDFEETLDEEIELFLQKVSRSIARRDVGLLFEDDTLDRKPRRALRTADLESEGYAHSFNGNTVVDVEETILGNVVVKGGNLTVYGKIEGDVMLIGGNVYVKDDGWVTGNVRVINGDIQKSESGRIDGFEDVSSSRASYRTNRSRFRNLGTSFDVPWSNEFNNLENVVLRYNRVEGLFFGLGSEKRYYWDGRRDWSAFGSAGWGFRSHTWRYNLGLARQFQLFEDGSNLLELGVEGYSLTDSKDKWIISTNENSAAAFFIHEDFLDYYSRKGVTSHVAWLTQGSLVRSEVRIAYLADTYDSLSLKTDWAMFGGNKVFRQNPLVLPGTMRSVVATIGFTTTDRTSHGQEGWAIHLSSEFGKNMKGSDYAFNQHVFDIRRYQPMGRYDNFNVRARLGSSEGSVPAIRSFELGGLGTLHAYRYKSLGGNRMLLVNAEYILDGDFLEDLDFWPADIFSGFTFIVLSDAAVLRTVPSDVKATNGFSNIRWSEWAHDLGFGIGNRNGTFRLAYTWRTDIKTKGTILFRFVRPF